MATDVASLQLKIDSRPAVKAKKALDDLSNAGKTTAKISEKLEKGIAKTNTVNKASELLNRKATRTYHLLNEALKANDITQEGYEAGIRRLNGSLRQQQESIGRTGTQFKALEPEVRGAAQATQQFTRQTQAAGKAAKMTAAQVETMEASTKVAGNGAKKLGQIAGQAGFQVQDFAVQVAGGQSALVAFGQQGSQLAGAFGPSGAIIGAIIAVSSALGGVFMASSRAAKESLEDLNIEVDALLDNFRWVVEQAV